MTNYLFPIEDWGVQKFFFSYRMVTLPNWGKSFFWLRVPFPIKPCNDYLSNIKCPIINQLLDWILIRKSLLVYFFHVLYWEPINREFLFIYYNITLALNSVFIYFSLSKLSFSCWFVKLSLAIHFPCIHIFVLTFFVCIY